MASPAAVIARDIDVWVNAPPPSFSVAIQNRIQDGISLFSRLKVRDAAAELNHSQLLANYNEAKTYIARLETSLLVEIQEHLWEVQALERDLHSLNQRVQNQEQTINTLSRAAPPVTPNQASDRARPIDITDPHIYNGSRSTLPAFIALLRLKIHGNASRFSAAQLLVAYADFRLQGDAFAQIQPQIKGDLTNGTTIDIVSVEALIVLLEEAFGDPDKVVTPQRELEALRQGK